MTYFLDGSFGFFEFDDLRHRLVVFVVFVVVFTVVLFQNSEGVPQVRCS